jgi:aspartyl/asparaginyl-tRNA synthetase
MDEFGGTTVTVAGWVRSIRDMKNFGFVMLNDGSCFKDLQVVMNREELANYAEVAALTVGCIFRGILEIYGTTNRLITVYPVAAAALMCIAAAAWIIPLATIWRMARES